MKKITLCLMLILALIILPGAIFASENVTEVADKAALVEAVKTSGTVKLTADIDLDARLLIDTGVSVTLDLNGKTLDLLTDEEWGDPNKVNYGVTVKGNLTITGKGTVDINGSYGIATAASGVLTVKNGTFNCLTGDYIIGNWGTTVIEDGTFNSNYCAVNGFKGGKKVEINGGKFINNDSQPVLGTVAVKSGEFNQLIDGRYLGENADIKVTLDRDIKTKSVYEDDITRPSEVTIPEGSKVTIDLNGHNITGQDGTNKVIVVEGGELTVTGKGTIKEANPYFAPILVYGSNNVSDTNYTKVTIGSDVTLEGWTGIMIGNGTERIFNAYGIEVNFNGKINAVPDAGGYVGSGIYVNGAINNKDTQNCPKINLNGAKISSKGAGIYAAGYAKWNIVNSTIEGVECGIGLKSGKLDIKNSNVIATGEAEKGEIYNNGINPTGSAIQIESNKGYAGEIELNINGGTYTSKNNAPIYEYTDENDANATTEVEKINITAGNFKSEAGVNAVLVSDNFKETFSNGFITGGTFSSDVKEYISSELNTWENQDGTVVVVKERHMELYVGLNGDVQYKSGAYATKDGYTVGRVGEKVYLTVTPEDGYEVTLTIKDAEGKNIAYGEDYSFVMPDSDVKINAEFTKEQVTPPAADENSKDETTVTPPADNEGPTGEGGTGVVEPGDKPTVDTEKPETPDVPKTGDNIVVYAVFAVVAMAGIAVTIKIKRK